MAKEQSGIRERERIDIDEPRRYAVILHNDDFTTMDFVVMVLSVVFFKPETEAMQLMLMVHQKGAAKVGVYNYDIAVSKTQKAIRMAREAGFPLRITYQPED